ncbi:AAA family ATPase [Paenibacillus sp. LMG 31459]|uniref:AAA family ATPase n=1 Tax=Paenibacillus phytohabitans TaxID=2654978 RepID=A0ABX1YJ23_9BACL|nr:AAA family ATPase [Paenibacillus phytohabitans]NOU80838.1 AAA family ATPase [Paenibacillus phytohabitans]
MKIESLRIDGYGRLARREMKLNEGVTVLFGRNEAGKSTTLQFIRAMLYGIPGRAYPAERYEPLQGGTHGGVLNARDDTGALWTIRRFASGGEGPGRGEKLQITLSHPDGTTEELPQAELERRLLGGISRSMFRQLFAVSLDELQELGALQSGEMSSYLFHAGMGGGGEIMRAEKRLVQDAEKLYKPRGKVQDAAKILQSIEKLEREVAESRSYLPRYNENTLALEAVEQKLLQMKDSRETAADRLLKLRKAQEIRELWLKWSEARLELAELPQIDAFPEAGVDRWKSLEGDLRGLQGAAFRLERLQAELAAELAANPPDSLLEQQGPALEALDRRRGSYEDKRTERQRLTGELAALGEQLQRILRSIGAGWSAAELAGFAASAADREAARRYAASFAGYDRQMETRGAELLSLRARTAAASASLQAAERQLAREHASGAADFAGIAKRSPRELLQLWDELQQAAERWREALLSGSAGGAEVPRRRGTAAGDSRPGGNGRRAQRYRRLLQAGAALTLLLPPALWLTGAPPVSAWSALGLLAAADLGLWAAMRAAAAVNPPPAPGGGEAGKAAAEMLRLRGLMLSGAKPESGMQDAGGLEAGMKELRRLMEAWNAWRQRVERQTAEVEACRTELAVLAGQERVLAEELDNAEASFTELAARYEEWLRQRGLPEGLSPDSLPDIFALAEQGNELLRQQGKLSLRLSGLESECAAYEQEGMILLRDTEAAAEARRDHSSVTLISSAHPDSQSGPQPEPQAEPPAGAQASTQASPDSLSLLTWLELRKREWEVLKTELLRRESIEARLIEVHEELAANRREQKELNGRSSRLLQEGGAEDGEQFLRRSSAWMRHSELTRSVRQWELAMFGGWEQEGKEELLLLLEHHDARLLEQERMAAEEVVLSLEEERSSLLQQRGKLLQEREDLRGRCMEDSALQQLEEQRAALHNLAGQYAVTALAAELMGRTRRIYEQEKQPQVLQLASVYFSKLTHGEYRRIVMTLGHKELKAEHKDAGLMDSGLLSRGTAEQLYLAIRLALSETMSSQVNLPLFFDDLFVNFDEHRLHAALGLLGELSVSRQIVMMTCHRHVAEAVAGIIPAAAVISV